MAITYYHIIIQIVKKKLLRAVPCWTEVQSAGGERRRETALETALCRGKKLTGQLGSTEQDKALRAMASNPVATAIHPSSNGLRPTSDGLQPNGNGLQPSSDGLPLGTMASNNLEELNLIFRRRRITALYVFYFGFWQPFL